MMHYMSFRSRAEEGMSYEDVDINNSPPSISTEINKGVVTSPATMLVAEVLATLYIPNSPITTDKVIRVRVDYPPLLITSWFVH